MRERIISVWLMLATASSVWAQPFGSTNLNIPTNAAIRLEFEKTEFLIGENVFANYVILNTGGPALKPSVGGDYRGGTRASRFKVTATRSDGYVAPDPEPFQWMMGGLSPSPSVTKGTNWFEHVKVARYCEIMEPGDYTVTVFHDLGWGPRQSNDVREVSAKLRFRLPAESEARTLVERTLSTPQHGGWTWGQRAHQLPDVATLYHPIYLPALIEQAENGSIAALTGIDGVRTVEGTEALVRLIKLPDAKPLIVPSNAMAAARSLERRLPRPPVYREFAPEQTALRKRMQATWNPRFAEPVRTFALALLQTTNRDALVLAASELAATGRAEDFDLLKPALERAATLTDTVWQMDHGYPYHQSVARSLAATAFQLGVTNHDFSKPKNAGEALLFLGYLRDTNSARPKDWERTSLRLLRDHSAFLRAETAWVVPRPPPAQIQQELVQLMADRDVAVQNWAFEALSGTRSPVVRSNVLHVLSSTSDRWLFNATVSLAMTNDARAEAAEIIAARFNDPLAGPGSTMPHEAARALVQIISGGGHISGGFNTLNDTNAMRTGWMDFVSRHRSELVAGRTFKPGDGSGFGELIAPGWQFYPPQP